MALSVLDFEISLATGNMHKTCDVLLYSLAPNHNPPTTIDIDRPLSLSTMTEEQQRQWQSKLKEFKAQHAAAKTRKYPTQAERNKDLDRLGAQVRRYKNYLEKPHDRAKKRKQNQATSPRKNQSLEGCNHQAPMGTPAAGAIVSSNGESLSEREYYQMKIDAIKRKEKMNMETIQSLSANDRRLEENNRRLEENNVVYRQIRTETNQDEDELIARCNAALRALL